MSFSTLEFILIFLPIFLVVYYVLINIQKRTRFLANCWIVIGGLAFCMYTDYISHGYYNILVIAIETVFSFCLALAVSYFGSKESCRLFTKIIMGIGVILVVGVLLAYKFLIKSLPIGLSFYSFTILAYLFDVYSKKIQAEKNFINFSSYILMFPKIVQGPITRYSMFQDRLKKRVVSIKRFDRALKLFIFGLSYKVLVADRLGSLFFEIQKIGFESISTQLAWMGAVSFSLQLYFDFMGYTLMAVGLGNMLGFQMPCNFDNPYASRSISEFYRRWHVTLGAWFRDYIYIPLGGNRKGLVRTLFNLLVVWLVTGLWHGTSLNYILWGASLFVFIALEKLFLGKLLKKSHVVSRIYTIFVIVLSWVVFAITDIKKLSVYFTRLFPFLPASYESNVLKGDYVKYGKMYGLFIGIAVILCVSPINKRILASRRKWISSLLCIVLLVLCLFSVARGLSNPFMYFEF